MVEAVATLCHRSPCSAHRNLAKCDTWIANDNLMHLYLSV